MIYSLVVSMGDVDTATTDNIAILIADGHSMLLVGLWAEPWAESPAAFRAALCIPV